MSALSGFGRQISGARCCRHFRILHAAQSALEFFECHSPALSQARLSEPSLALAPRVATGSPLEATRSHLRAWPDRINAKIGKSRAVPTTSRPTK